MINFEKYSEEFKSYNESIEFGSPVDISEISLVEASLGTKISGQYLEFLRNIGGVAIFNSWINGISKDDPLTKSAGNLHGDTLRMREFGLPTKYLVIKTSEEEFAWCLDSSLDSESPVYGIDIPFKSKVYQIAKDFYTYVEENLQEAIKTMDED